MRAIGQEPTDEEIQNLVQEVDRSGTGCLNFHDFLALLAHISQVSFATKLPSAVALLPLRSLSRSI